MKFNWIVKNLFGFQCSRCGTIHKLPKYLPIDDFLEIEQAFINLHKLCRDPNEVTHGTPDASPNDVG